MAKTFFHLLFFLLIIPSAAYSFDNYLDINFGYKRGHYQRDVDIALIDDGTPGFLQIKYKNLSFFNMEARGKLHFFRNFYVRAAGEYGWLTSGNVTRDVDLVVLQPSLLGNFDAHGHVVNLDGGIGYTLLCWNYFDLSPVLGLGYNHQSISAVNSATVFSNKVTWIGPWLGFDAHYQPASCFFFDLQYAYHWARCHDYHVDLPFGAASLDFKFDRAAGNTVFLGGTYLWATSWRFGLSFSYETWKTIDSPDISAIAVIPFTLAVLDETDYWSSWSLMAKIGYSF